MKPKEYREEIPGVAILLALAAGALCYAHSGIGVIGVLIGYLLLGILICVLVFPAKRPELRTFVLSFSICAFTSGIAQCYSLAIFGTSQSTGDALNFYSHIAASPPFAKWVI